jgi:hypothetical protein
LILTALIQTSLRSKALAPARRQSAGGYALGVEVSPDLISVVTDAVLEHVAEWQNRPLDALYALVFFDALRVKIRDEGTVRNKAVYVALGVRPDGSKEILGLWIEQTEGAKFWLRVMNELRNRGVLDMLIAVVDGLKGFPEAINAVFPEGNELELHQTSPNDHQTNYSTTRPQVGSQREIVRASCQSDHGCAPSRREKDARCRHLILWRRSQRLNRF